MTRYRDLPAACAWAAMASMNSASADPRPPPEPLQPAAAAVQTTSMSATILAIGRDTRVISLQAEGGERFEFTAGEEVGDFDLLHAGDRVLARHVRWVVLEPDHAGAEPPGETVPPGVESGPAAAPPWGSLGRKVTIAAQVVAVNAKEGRVTLLGPRGTTLALDVSDPAQLARMRAGDRVRAIYTEAFSLQVRPSPHEGAGR